MDDGDRTEIMVVARRMLILCIVAFALHYIWENSHVVLYTNFQELTTIPIMYYATMGDVLYTLIAVCFVTLFKGRIDWFAVSGKRDIFILGIMGFWIALFVEYKALALGRWAYLDAMPILPFFHVGLTPILQMTILLPLTIFLVAEIDKIFMRLMR